MSTFKVDDLVRVTQTGSAPKPGFIDSINGGLYTIEYLDNTTEDKVEGGRLKKHMPATIRGRPALITDRRRSGPYKQDPTPRDYMYSVMYTDDWYNNPNRVDMVDFDEIGLPSKGGRTRRLRKAKKSKKRTRRR